MFGKENLIFIIDDNVAYGKLIKATLKKHSYNNVRVFTKEHDFLDNMDQYPHIVICDYHLNTMNGLKLIELAKETHPFFYSILLSGEFHINTENVLDQRFIHLVDRYLVKNMDELKELVHTLEYEV